MEREESASRYQSSGDQLEWLARSRANIVGAASAGAIEPARLRCVADHIAERTLVLSRVHVDPVEHVRMAHRLSRPRLEQLATRPNLEVRVGDRLYTPRKVLRRVLDHALDHLHQVQQWIDWQEAGILPQPADGWVDSYVTLDEDRLPLSSEDLDSWMWRIDLTVEMLVRRAQELSEVQLDWQPPAGGWTLRQVLHHEATAERYYTSWMEEPVNEDPLGRYVEARHRFDNALEGVLAAPIGRELALIDGESMECSPEQLVDEVLAAEESLASGRSATCE